MSWPCKERGRGAKGDFALAEAGGAHGQWIVLCGMEMCGPVGAIKGTTAFI